MKSFDRMDILLAEHLGEMLKLFAHVNSRLDGVESRADERHAEVMAAIRGIQG